MSEALDLEKLKRGQSDQELLDVVLQRWSPRAYAETPVTDAELKQIFSAGAWAASSFNGQPWRFVLGRKGEKAWQLIFDSLNDFNRSWTHSSPVLYASFAKKTFEHDGSNNRHAHHDVGAASATVSLQAMAIGLHTHGMAGFDPDKLRAAFNVPEDFEPVACWTVGRLGDPNTLTGTLHERELAARSRKPIAAFVFNETWEKPAL